MAEKWGFQIQSSLVSQHLTDAQYIQGGYIVVKDNTSRDKLPVKTETTDGVIIEGSLVYVSDDKKSYRYTNSAWVEENADIQIDNETIVKNSDDELVSTTKAFKPGSTATETYTVNEGLESGTNWSYTIDKIDESYKVSSVVMSSNNFPFTKVCNYEESDDNGETWTTNTQTSENQVSTDFTVTFDSVKIYKNIVFQFQWRSNPATAHTTSFGVMYDVVETTVVEDSVVDMQEKLNFTYDSEDGNKITAIDGHNLKYYKSDWNTTDVNEPTYIYNKPSFGLGLNLEQVDKTNPYNYIDIYKHNLITDEYIKLNTTSSAAIAFDFSEDTAEQCASTDDNVVEFIIKTKIPIDDFEQVSVTYITYSAQTTISLISDVGHLFTKPGNRGPVRDIQLWVKEKSYNEIKIGYTFGESSTITGADNSLYIGTSLTTYKLYDIASTNNVSVNYDNDTIKVNEEGKLYADIESGTTVEANPSDEAEETLSKIKIDDTIYSIDGSVVIPNVEFDYTDKDGNILPSGGTKVMIFRVSSTSDEYFDTKINEEGYRFYVNDNYFARYSTLNNRCLIINSDNEIVLYNKGTTIGVTDQVSFEAYLTENYGTPVPVNGLRPLEISNIKIDDAAYRIVGQKYSGGNGIEISIDNVISSTIYANPTEEATEDLSKLKVGDTVYNVNEIAVKESVGTINEKKIDLIIEDLSPKEVYDKNGHIYGYTQIGDKYWMTSNYRYDDGRETGIIYNNYITNETDEQKGLLYTLSAMKDIELPDGWRIPTIKDWHDLFVEGGVEKYKVNTPTNGGGWDEENQTYDKTANNEWAYSEPSQTGPMKMLWSTEVHANSDDVFGLSFYRTGRGDDNDEVNPEADEANYQSNIWAMDEDGTCWNIQGFDSTNNAVYQTQIRIRTKNAQAIRLVKDV